MAEYEERSLDDLTEEPTQHRLDELRSKGQVAQSRELTSMVGLLGIFLALYFVTNTFVHSEMNFMKDLFGKNLVKVSSIDDLNVFSEVGREALKVMASIFLPIAFAGFSLAIIGSISQIGVMFTTETLTPDFERLNPIAGFFRIFSFKSIVETLKSLGKLIFILLVVYSALSAQAYFLPNLVGLSISQLITYIADLVFRVIGSILLVLVASAGIDYWVSWMRFRKQARMTKAEAKQELKEREGDPHIKARIRSIQREAARKRMMKSVPKADVIITNPTHIAVAIQYDPENGMAPKVLAKGADYLAERIKKIAREHEIPTVENKPLARTLYKHVKVGQMIPRSLYQAVAEILAYVYKLKGKKILSKRI